MSRLLTLEGLSAGFDGLAVVRDLDLHVDEGEVVALLGPNGAGKTTTLLTVSGLLRPLGGRVEVLGAAPSLRAPHRQARAGLAHVPEERAIFASLTVRENLRLGGDGSGMERAFEYFPALGPLVDRRAGLLSGGEQQMLALGRALASEPRLLLVDELSLGLAPIIVEQLLPTIRRFVEETGGGALIVEQHFRLVLGTADRGYLLSHGTLLAEGPAARLLADPDLLEAGYLGTAPT
jgi:branched-chain amino acid transport system ATP-binding protein